MFGTEGGELAGLRAIPLQVWVRDVGAIRDARIRRWLIPGDRGEEGQEEQRGPHATTSEMGPRLSMNRSVSMPIFCNMVSIRLLSRAFSSLGLPQRLSHSS